MTQKNIIESHLGERNNMKQIEFGPMTIQKEEGLFYSYLLVENGPVLMKDGKYTRTFKKIIKKFPSIMSATFSDNTYINYKIKTKGRRDVVINGIKKILLKEMEKEK